MLTTFFFTNILAIFSVFLFSGASSFTAFNKNRNFKLITLFFSIIMLIEFLVDVFSAQTLGTLSTFNLNFDILNFKLYFALEGFTVFFVF